MKDPKHRDEDALLDAVFGALQLGFNGGSGSITTAYVIHFLVGTSDIPFCGVAG